MGTPGHAMLRLAVLLGAAALAAGLCMEEHEVALACTVNTAVGAKLGPAFATCSTDTDQATWGKGKGKGKKCPTVEDIEAEVFSNLADELCVFGELGWIDSEMNFDNATYNADIASLPGNVSAQLSEDILDQCAMDKLAEMGEEKKWKKCEKKYSDEEKARLFEIGSVLANVSCFLENFEMACEEHVGTQIREFFTQLAMPGGRK